MLLHVVVRLLISPTVNIDDAREAIFAQTLAWGYQPRQPPLYDWLVWGAFQLLGPGVLALTLVKYGLLAAAYAFLRAAAGRVLADPRLPTLAAFSLLLLVPVGWFVHEDLTHSVAVLAAGAATLDLALRIAAAPSLMLYLALGVAVGLGILSKFTYALFAAALVVAALTLGSFRARLLDPRALASLAAAAVVALPYALWLAGHGFAPGRLYAEELHVGSAPGYLAGAASGLYYLVRFALYYAAPLGLVLLVLCPRAYARGTVPDETRAHAGRLVERLLLAGLGLLALTALAGALAYLKFRWLIPALFPLPLYAVWRLERAGVDRRQLRRYAAVLVAAEAAVVGGILLRAHGAAILGKPDRLNAPFEAEARQIAAAGFRRGTVVTGTGPVGGNLRLAFPDSRLLSLDLPHYVPPARGGGQCLVAWERGGGAAVPPDLRAFLASALDAPLTGAEPVRVAEAPYRRAPGHTHRVYYVVAPDGLGRCR